MSAEVEFPPERTTIELVNGILSDLQHLIEQQIQLTRREFEQEFRKRSSAAVVFALGLGILFLDAIEFCQTLVHLLHWMTSPVKTDPAWIPLWACHSVVASALGVIGGILLYVGRARFNSVNPSRNPAIDDLKENASWMTTQN